MQFNWQQEGWPSFTFSRAALRDELDAFAKAFRAVKAALKSPQCLESVADTLAAEAVTTSAIEGVVVDGSVVMSSICKALGVACAPNGFAKDVHAEGVARMMLAVREEWDAPLSADLLRRWHGVLLSGRPDGITVGDFRSHSEPMRVVRRNAYGTMEIRFEAPPSDRVPGEIDRFLHIWQTPAKSVADIALRAAFLHPHFESIHPFEDGNGRVGRALVAKALAEGLGMPVILPVSTIIARHRKAYYDEINAASRSLEWTSWAAFFIPVLTETLTSFLAAIRFVAAKRTYLERYAASFSERARKAILRMFDGGEEGVRSGLSAAKWMRMTKVSKPTATRDLAELESVGAIVSEGAGPMTRYRLNCAVCELTGEPIEGINEGINDRVLMLVHTHPGCGVPFLASTLTASRATVERSVAALIAAGKLEHRGSRKTGGYFAK